MPGGKIAFYTGILDKLKLTDDEAAMIMGHEMARPAASTPANGWPKRRPPTWACAWAQLLGLGDLGNAAASLGGQLLTLKFSRSDETDADLVGLELAARAGYQPDAAVSLWQKMGKASGQPAGGARVLSTHPRGRPHPRVAAKRAQVQGACTRRRARRAEAV